MRDDVNATQEEIDAALVGRTEYIEFTQYTLPDGRRSQELFPTTPEIKELADDLIKKGYVFEIEALRNGTISATIGDPKEELDVAFALSPNGPPLLVKIDTMIRDFHKKIFPPLLEL